DLRLTAESPFDADFARDARNLRRKRIELIDHRVDRRLQLRDFAAHFDGDLLRQIAVGDRSRDVGDVAYLRREIAGHRVDGISQVLPRALQTSDLRLSAESSFDADFARDTRDFGGE